MTVELHDVEQRSPEWYALRLGTLTASIAREALGSGVTRDRLLRQLVAERITGEPRPFFTNDAIQWGIDHEYEARTFYELETGVDVTEIGFVTNTNQPGVGVSPDGLIGDEGLVEIKCPQSATHLEYLERKACPARYVPQVQLQLLITDRHWCDFVSYDPRFPVVSRLKVIRVVRDETYIRDKLLPGLADFLGDLDGLTRRYS